MKVVILAGGLGTRLGELTEIMPKPMVDISGSPIIVHIMKIYARFGFKDFIVALGYKGDVIKKYFSELRVMNSDISVDLASGKINYFNDEIFDWNVTLVNTGSQTMTGGRLSRLRGLLNDEPFMLTYGDGVANIDINELLLTHRKFKRVATVSAVHPSARFGLLSLQGSSVVGFKEKPQSENDWINGGFFVFEPAIFDYLPEDDGLILENEPLERLALENELAAYKHQGFWACMDTMRDKDYLENLCSQGNAPWLNFDLNS
jgi:glucose-1-phosphate cytidylyltransferase